VDRRFVADRPDALWVADITYIPTSAGFLYLAIVLDVFSRRMVGWSMSTTLETGVVLAALDMALAVRKPQGVIHYSSRVRNTPRWPSDSAAASWTSARRWVRSATPTTTPWRRASSPRWNVS